MKTQEQGFIGLTLALVVGGLILMSGLAYFGLGLDKAENRAAVKEEMSAQVDKMDSTDDSYNEQENARMMQQGSSTNMAASTTVQSDNGVAFTLKMANLSLEQKAFLKLKGIEGDEIKVTNKMVTCANAKLGSERVVAIKNGAELSMTEKVQLLACYE